MPVTLVDVAFDRIIICDMPGTTDRTAQLSVIMLIPIPLRLKKEST